MAAMVDDIAENLMQNWGPTWRHLQVPGANFRFPGHLASLSVYTLTGQLT